MSLFKDSGAKYIVPIAEHSDGFSMYNSSVNKWNSVDTGPKKDVIEQDYRKIKCRLTQGLGIKNFESAKRTIAGIEIVHMLKKNQLLNPKNSTCESFKSLARWQCVQQNFSYFR